MKAADYILLAIIAACFVAAVIKIIRRGTCSCGNCTACSNGTSRSTSEKCCRNRKNGCDLHADRVCRRQTSCDGCDARCDKCRCHRSPSAEDK